MTEQDRERGEGRSHTWLFTVSKLSSYYLTHSLHIALRSSGCHNCFDRRRQRKERRQTMDIHSLPRSLKWTLHGKTKITCKLQQCHKILLDSKQKQTTTNLIFLKRKVVKFIPLLLRPPWRAMGVNSLQYWLVVGRG